ncbi:MAG: hypothetical protein EU539_07755 [Promethearchaeota archaeon]|nr:MAG: hypothetical protein EU539_07755 [Candidatus Lokiarchaeota archaeon]
MDITSKFLEIKNFLSIPDEKFDLGLVLNGCSEQNKALILDKVISFINHFAMFKLIKPFMNSLYICVKKTLEIPADVNDYDELLVKNSIMRFIQEYITYSNLQQKEEILNFLAESLGKLKLEPLIINLGLLLKPMYSDQAYLEKIKDYEEIEVTYLLNDENELRIKREIDKWLETQEVNLDNQDVIRDKLKEVYDKLIGYFKLSKNSEIYTKLLKEVNEMLAMRLTVMSLMESIDESFEPIPIRK